MNSTNPNRTAHLLALMKNGDDAFNSRDFAGMPGIGVATSVIASKTAALKWVAQIGKI